jgi:hypothetical protein
MCLIIIPVTFIGVLPMSAGSPVIPIKVLNFYQLPLCLFCNENTKPIPVFGLMVAVVAAI